MKKCILFCLVLIVGIKTQAQIVYTMGYEKAEIEVLDPKFFSTYQLPDFPGECGIYDKESATFYTCNYKTYRNVNEDFVIDPYTSNAPQANCCDKFDFDPKKYYGTLTLKGVIESVEWDSMVVYFTTDMARLRIQVDEREVDYLYKEFYKENHLGKVHVILRLKTYDTPKENVLSYNKNTEETPKPERTFIRILRW